MDKLPLEMKQRICSFLHASPKLLKPIRLVSQQFAAAAAPYLLPRIFLVKHKDSCAEVREIVEHPVFSKHVTTLIVDPSHLKNHKSLQLWVDEHDHLRKMYPDWWNFKPQDIEYDDYDNPRLETSQARAKWSDAFRKFEQAVNEVSRTLKQSQEHYWKAQRQIATYQSTEEFRQCFLDTIAHAFKSCPNLVNIVVAPPQPGQDYVVNKLLSMFRSIHPSRGAWVDADSHDPFEFGLAELMSAANEHAVDLNSLTIIDLPFKIADYSDIKSLKPFESLKHIRIGYANLEENPKTSFGFNLEAAMHEASSLETIWVDMPGADEAFDGNAFLHALNSETLRDVLLRELSISEDTLVRFLLRHSQSLQQLDLCVTLTDGTWPSVLRRISCQMTALERLHLFGVWFIDGSTFRMFSEKWCYEASNFVLEGGVLPEPYTDEQEDEDGTHNDHIVLHDPTCRDLPEDGLWADYDTKVNSVF
ncbi:hypothetical protein E4T52_07483 [Aureobasidium sp. EXF-3400]|nr:hypothetical protein E4T51_06401 [Aureobasidium sp. EXF-12344]KAI4777585.1 hypothetical protein E4T52_07483 [Aureobasidium sp. EXF-3400]